MHRRKFQAPKNDRIAFRLHRLAESGGPERVRLRSRCGAAHIFGLDDHFS